MSLSPRASKHLRERIKKHEGVCLKPYECTEGYLTIGVGRNLETRGLSPREVDLLLSNDLQQSQEDARDLCRWDQLSEPRKTVLIEMCFQLGKAGVSKFTKFLTALDNQDYEKASEEMLDSRWARQTPARAKLLAEVMRTNEYQD